MKNLFLVLGVIFSILIIIVGVWLFLVMKLTSQSKAYVDETVPKIISDWNVQILRTQSTKELLGRVSPEEMAASFKKLSEQFGPFKEYKGSTGKVNVEFVGFGMVTTADYEAEASFEKATVKIVVHLQLVNRIWQIENWQVQFKII